MAGLVSAICEPFIFRLFHNNTPMTQGGWVYIMTNRPNGTLYVGTATNLARRAWEHKEGVVDGFTKRYGLRRLVYAEWPVTILTAKQREMNIKHWPRAWKIRLILRENPATLHLT